MDKILILSRSGKVSNGQLVSHSATMLPKFPVPHVKLLLDNYKSKHSHFSLMTDLIVARQKSTSDSKIVYFGFTDTFIAGEICSTFHHTLSAVIWDSSRGKVRSAASPLSLRKYFGKLIFIFTLISLSSLSAVVESKNIFTPTRCRKGTRARESKNFVNFIFIAIVLSLSEKDEVYKSQIDMRMRMR